MKFDAFLCPFWVLQVYITVQLKNRVKVGLSGLPQVGISSPYGDSL